MTDAELLEQHRTGSPDAFAQIVRRHLDWVYSVARRRLGADANLADDVTQSVFIALARKAPRLRRDRALSPWLFGVVRLASQHAQRTESTRRRHEAEAAKMQKETSDSEVNYWQDISPHLDGMVDRLRSGHRDAVLLRFYECKSFAQVGAALGVSEEAARKRVDRAIAKLRDMLEKKGIGVSTTALGGILQADLVGRAPAALATSATAQASTVATTSGLAKGFLGLIASMQIKLSVGIALAVLLAAGGAAISIAVLGAGDGAQHALAAPASQPVADNSNAEFERVYHLEDNQFLKHIPPPQLAARSSYFIKLYMTRGRPSPREAVYIPPIMWLDWNGTLHSWGMSAREQCNLDDVLRMAIDLHSYDYDLPDQLSALRFSGDWIIRRQANVARRLDALSQIFQTEFNISVHFVSRPTEQDVILVTGKYSFHTLPGTTGEDAKRIQLYFGQVDPPGTTLASNAGTLKSFCEEVGSELRTRFIINQTQSIPSTRVAYAWNGSAIQLRDMPRGQEKDAKFKQFLDALAGQTGLTYTPAKRTFDVWHAVEDP